MLPSVCVAFTFALPLVGIFAVMPFSSNRFTMNCWVALERRKHKKLLQSVEEGDLDAKRLLPICLAEDWASRFGTKYNPICDSNSSLPSRLYWLFFLFIGMSITLSAVTEWGVFLMSWQRSLPAKESANVFLRFTRRSPLSTSAMRTYASTAGSLCRITWRIF